QTGVLTVAVVTHIWSAKRSPAGSGDYWNSHPRSNHNKKSCMFFSVHSGLLVCILRHHCAPSEGIRTAPWIRKALHDYASLHGKEASGRGKPFAFGATCRSLSATTAKP